MSKNIIIQEGGTSKQMTVNKLKTDKVDGGTCLWVPEDEASLGTKSITSNGTYKASDDGKYGYSQVTVNIPGGPGSANPDGTPNTGGGTPSSPGGSGSAIAGHDSSDGNDYVIGVDSNGGIVKTLVPSSIDIIDPPTKTTYTDGEPVDTTGMVAVLRDGNGNIYTSEEYPDGHIPLDELIIPSDSAIAHQTSEAGIATSDLSDNPVSFTGGDVEIYYDKEGKTGGYLSGGGSGCIIDDGYNLNLIRSSSSPFIYESGDIRNGEKQSPWVRSEASLNYTYNGKAVYFAMITTSRDLELAGTSCPISYVPGSNIAAWTMANGNIEMEPGSQNVSIEWTNPYNGKVLQTTFNIKAGSGSGYSDNSEESGSGGGTNIPGGGSSSDSGGSGSGGGTNI